VPLHGLRADRRGDRQDGAVVNLAQSLLAAAERHPEAEAVVDGTTRLSYAELLDRARRLAGGLAADGIGAGDRVAAVVKCRRESVELYWACQWLGATFVPLSHRVSQADLDYCHEDSGAKVWFEVDADLEPLYGAEHPGALDRDEREESLMLYTSGTTGRPKGVPRSHRADRAGGLSQALQHGYRYGDRTLGVMPLYHTMGMHSLIAMSLLGGCYVCRPDWDAGDVLALIARERISSLYLAPTLYHDLVLHPQPDAHDLSSVGTLAYAGAAMTSALVERCVEVFQPRLFVNHYGSTEIYTFSVHRDQAAKPGCAGRPSIHARLRLGEDDEILCHMSSDEAFTGYWNRPDADERAIRDGWYHTGDVGRIDDDGDLWVVGRVDDMIVSGGENIHPLEVEDMLAAHASVREVAVVGAPDERLGHRVVAIVVADEDVSADDLDRWCLESETLARFKRPREYRFVDALPKSPSGKILRRMLREEAPST
jgi:2-furoate---CoA ligase